MCCFFLFAYLISGSFSIVHCWVQVPQPSFLAKASFIRKLHRWLVLLIRPYVEFIYLLLLKKFTVEFHFLDKQMHFHCFCFSFFFFSSARQSVLFFPLKYSISVYDNCVLLLCNRYMGVQLNPHFFGIDLKYVIHRRKNLHLYAFIIRW